MTDTSSIKDESLRAALDNLEKSLIERELREPAEPLIPENSPNVVRLPPRRDNQRDFFVPCLYEIPLKDDVYLMDIAPFALNKNKRLKELVYDLPGSKVTVTGSATYGMATAHDYDIVIYMISQLMCETNRFQKERDKGSYATPPARDFAPHAYNVLKFCRRGNGGLQYQALESALDRLQGTTVKIENFSHKGKRRAGGFPLIDGWKTVSKSSTGKVEQVTIGIPNWIYDGIVQGQTPSVITLNRDYFLLKGGIDKFLYRFARRTAGKEKSVYPIEELYKRSGSTREKKKFLHDIRKRIGRRGTLLEYHITLEGSGPRTHISFTHNTYAPKTTQYSPCG